MKHALLLGTASAALLLFAAQARAEGVDAPAEVGTIEEIVVFGQGETRQVQEVSGQEIQIEVPGASPLKLVEKLPNVNLQSADPFGAYEWAARISIRAFGQNQLGFTLNDIPLGDMSYGAHNGLHISRAIAGENVGSVELAQGAGSLATPSSNNLGGSLVFKSRDPAREFGAEVAATAGSNDTYRGFIRLESGEIATGARAYLSYSYNTADKWKGDGEQRHQQINFKAVQPIGEGALTGQLNWSKRRENDYQDLSLGMISRLGYEWDNISDNWALAVALAEIGNNTGYTGVPGAFPSFGTTYPAPFANPDDAYFNAAGLRDDLLGSLTFETPIGESFDVRATVYGHDNEGQGLWFTPYLPSPNYGVAGATTDNAPISIRTTEYDISRWGVVAGATWELGAHSINAGVWYEDNDFTNARRFYALNRAAPQRDSLEMQSNPFLTQWEYDFTTKTVQFHLQDTWTITDQLSVNFGFKSLSVENTAKTVTGPNKTGTIEAEENFLPQAGVRFDLTEDAQLFASYSKNMRAFASSATTGPFSGTQAVFDAIRDELKPETSDTFEAGVRYRMNGFQGVLAAYHVEFKDRLFGVPVGAGILGNAPALSNVGGVTAKGVEAAVNWEFSEYWSLFSSYAYNDSTYDEDTLNGAGTAVVARTAGKTTVDTPKHLFKADLGYDNGAFFARISLNHTGKRFFTYENDRSVPKYTVADLAIGYRFSGSPWLEGLELQLNVSNLFDKKYLSTINSNGSPLRGDSQTLLPAAPQQAFVTVRKSF